MLNTDLFNRIKPELLASPENAGLIALREGFTVGELLWHLRDHLSQVEWIRVLMHWADKFQR